MYSNSLNIQKSKNFKQMKQKLFNAIKYIFFLGLGVFIFWLIYRKIDVNEIIKAFKEVNYFWIFASLVFSILSLISRAIRWRLLIHSIGYKPRFLNVFLSCNILYLVNLFVPRAGEVARCSVVSSTDKIPFAKLVGTMLVERLADFVMLAFLAVVIFLFNIPTIKLFFDAHPEMTAKILSLASTRNIVFAILALLFVLSGIYYFLRNRKKRKALEGHNKESLWSKLMEGVYSISKLKNKWEFLGHTLFIFAMWLAMLYVVFLAYEPTAHLSVRVGMVTFLMGGLAMLAPIQGGIGPWHFMVFQTLLIYGIPEKQGRIFAFIAHTTTNLVYIIFGAIALLLVFVLNSGKIKLTAK
jgi:glycosyltransferase 2 family protein